MALQITMLIYSGRRDPQWTIEGAEEAELRRLIASSAADSATPVKPHHLGYRGFKVVDPAAPQQPLLRLARSIPSFSFTGAPEIEGFLLRTKPEQLPSDIELPFPLPPESIAFSPPTEIQRIVRAVTCPLSRAADAPTWTPGDPKWENQGEWDNNCYNYATNIRTDTFASIGLASGNDFNNLTGAGATSGSLSDGLRHSFGPGQNLIAGQGHHVCLVVSPGADFHWYRQDSNGCWSHKIGSNPVTNLDYDGMEIPDPRTCNRGPYTLFVAWLRVPPGITIQ